MCIKQCKLIIVIPTHVVHCTPSERDGGNATSPSLDPTLFARYRAHFSIKLEDGTVVRLLQDYGYFRLYLLIENINRDVPPDLMII